MSYMRFNFRSQALGRYVDVSIVYPTDAYSYYPQDSVASPLSVEGARSRVYVPGMKFQTVYLIHGGGDDDTLTYRYSNAERYAQDKGAWAGQDEKIQSSIEPVAPFSGDHRGNDGGQHGDQYNGRGKNTGYTGGRALHM